MKVLYFDCFSGISGDMTLGALIDLGIDKDIFKSELDKLNLAGYNIVIQKKIKNGITGTDVHVLINEEYEHLQEKIKSHEHEGHDHNHHHGITTEHAVHTHSHCERNLNNIEELIDTSDLNQKVKEFSKTVFREIAKAEAKVHNKPIQEVHFHEVGAIDSIVDIVGTAICLDMLGIEKVFSSPLHDGKGFIQCQHGQLPVPVPAVMEMLTESRIPLITEDINTELVTPTGIGIIKCLTTAFGNMPAIMISKCGYGMGKRETGRFNALRIVMGTLAQGANNMEEVAMLETNIDDMSPELLGFVMEKLLDNGALDVFYTPIHMKKSRPAVMLSVVCRKENEEKLADIILKETTTLGIRRTFFDRYFMDREIVSVKTQFGDVRVKVASKGDLRKIAPEYEDCREIAKATGFAISRVYEIIVESSKHLL